MLGLETNSLDLIENNTNNYLDNIINNIPHFVFWKDKNSVLLGCNEVFSSSAGLKDPKDIIGKTDFDMPWGKFEAESYVKDDQKIMLSGKADLNIEETQTNDSGKKIHLSTNKVPMTDKKGNIIGVLAIYSDVTKQKKLENDLRKANDIKSEFIANMSHDMRTPMTGILGMFVELRHLAEEIIKYPERSSSVSGELMKHIDMGEKSADELLDLFNEILESISLESGKVSRTSENFNLQKVILKNMNLLRSTANYSGIELSVNIEEGVPKNLYGQRKSLDRILMNLISNAIKFTEEGEVNIKARMTSKTSLEIGEEIQLQISVEDTGIGIPKDKFEEIFGNFAKLVSSYRGIYKGYGLGLHAVKKYIANMGGDIEVESTVGVGSRFILNLPFVVSDYSDQEEKPSTLTRNNEQTEPPTINKESENKTPSVLVAEDSAPAALSIISSLKRLGCLVDHAITGKNAIEMVRNNRYDLVYMDIGLPDISGIEATKEIRKFSSVPVIALTGHIDKEEVCLESGMQELLVKPARPTTLKTTLHKYFSLKDKKTETELDQTVIDWEGSLKTLNGNKSVAKDLIGMCAENIDESMLIINDAYNKQDIRKLGNELHRALSGVCYLKLPQLERALKNFHITTRECHKDIEKMEKSYLDLKTAAHNFQERFSNADFYS